MISEMSNSVQFRRFGNIMTDGSTNTVYFSELLLQRCPILYQHLARELTVNNICHFLLKNTKDIWCRDYMPIQNDMYATNTILTTYRQSITVALSQMLEIWSTS